ncbi:MAG: SDR family NAD(P)-dependent oxidoreductase [Planctomycetales bacterium]
MKHVLITGGAGFIGSHLAERLIDRGDRVTVVDDESTGSADNLRAIADHPRFQYHRGDVGQPAVLAPLVEGIDEAYHLAAAVGVKLVAENPARTIETNIQPTELLLRLLRDQLTGDPSRPVKLFLASTSEVYGKNPKPRWTEDDDLVWGKTTCMRWSYGASKAIDEFLALAHHRQFGLPVVIGRLFNVVGPRQTGAYGMVLPRFAEAAAAGKPLLVHDDGLQSRCFAHVKDVVRWIVALMENPEATGQVVNIGGDEPITIEELAQTVVRVADSDSRIEHQSYRDAYGDDFEDVRHRVPDLSRLRDLTNLAPEYSLEETIAEVLAVLDSRK